MPDLTSNMRTYLLLTALTVLSLGAGCYETSETGTNMIRYPVDNMDGLVTQTGVEIDGEITADGNGSLAVETDSPLTVELYRVRDIDLDNTRVVYKARLKTQDLAGSDDMKGIAYLEMKATFPDGEELVARGPRIPPSGTTDWGPGDAILYIDKGESPREIELNMVVDGTGKVWVDDIVLEYRPLRLDYLFWGHAVVWGILIIYIIHLLSKQRKLKREMEALKAAIRSG